MTRPTILLLIMVASDVFSDEQSTSSGLTTTGQSGGGPGAVLKPVKKYFESEGPGMKALINCTRLIYKLSANKVFDDEIKPCLADKWALIAGAPTFSPTSDRECCYMFDRMCSINKYFALGCHQMAGYDKLIGADLKRVTDDCKRVAAIDLSAESCAKLQPQAVNRTACQRWTQCKPGETISPAQMAERDGGLLPGDQNTVITTKQSDPNQKPGPTQAVPTADHKSSAGRLTTCSQLGFVVISLLTFITLTFVYKIA